jgi:hypothetical protein
VNSARFRNSLQVADGPSAARVEHADRSGSRHRFQEQFESLGIELSGEHVHAGDVAAGPRETRNHAGFHQTLAAPKAHNDGDGRSRLFGRQNSGRTHRDDDVDLHPDEVSSELRKPAEIVLGRAHLESHRLPFDVTELAQRLDECGPLSLRGREEADPPYLPRLLPLGGERRGEESGS